MPRSVPALETEQLAWASVEGVAGRSRRRRPRGTTRGTRRGRRRAGPGSPRRRRRRRARESAPGQVNGDCVVSTPTGRSACGMAGDRGSRGCWAPTCAAALDAPRHRPITAVDRGDLDLLDADGGRSDAVAGARGGRQLRCMDRRRRRGDPRGRGPPRSTRSRPTCWRVRPRAARSPARPGEHRLRLRRQRADAVRRGRPAGPAVGVRSDQGCRRSRRCGRQLRATTWWSARPGCTAPTAPASRETIAAAGPGAGCA